VHRADAEIAAGREVRFEPDIAADAIDEWLGFLSGLGGEEDPRLGALPDGAVLHVHATDDGLDGAGEWLVRRKGSEVTVQPGHGRGDVALRGPAGRLLLVLMRRVPPDDPQVQVLGDRALLDGWLAATPF
jgi:MDMPI C-terminal domain